MEIKKYVVKCHKCNKDLVINLTVSRMGHLTFIDKMIINNKESNCNCLKEKELDICSIQILLRQLQYLYNNRDRISIELENN